MRWLDRKEQTEGLRHEQETGDRDKDASALNARTKMIGQASAPMEVGSCRNWKEMEQKHNFQLPVVAKFFLGLLPIGVPHNIAVTRDSALHTIGCWHRGSSAHTCIHLRLCCAQLRLRWVNVASIYKIQRTNP